MVIFIKPLQRAIVGDPILVTTQAFTSRLTLHPHTYVHRCILQSLFFAISLHFVVMEIRGKRKQLSQRQLNRFAM